MGKTDVGPRSRRSQAPNPDGSVDEGALASPGVSALTRTVERLNHNLTTVAVVYTEALWDPEQALLPAAIGPGAVSLGTIRQVLHGPRYGGLPQVIHLHVTLYEVRQADGTLLYMAPIPPCFHPETGIHEALAAELVADLPHFGLRSEQHTSELQSLMRISYAVFCLKNKHQTTSTTTYR